MCVYVLAAQCTLYPPPPHVELTPAPLLANSSNHQLKFHSAFERSTARVIYRADWKQQKPQIMAKNGWAKCSSEVLISVRLRSLVHVLALLLTALCALCSTDAPSLRKNVFNRDIRCVFGADSEGGNCGFQVCCFSFHTSPKKNHHGLLMLRSQSGPARLAQAFGAHHRGVRTKRKTPSPLVAHVRLFAVCPTTGSRTVGGRLPLQIIVCCPVLTLVWTSSVFGGQFNQEQARIQSYDGGVAIIRSFP